MLKSILLLTMLTLNINTKCTTGCLKCDEQNECQFCDTSQNYKLNNKECEKVTLENCEMMNFDGDCYVCVKEYFLDQSTKKCVEVGTSDIIENCLMYSSSNSCQLCDKNFYITTNTCKAVENPIEFCNYYENNDQCQQCEGEYILSLDKKKCSENPSQSNCSFYSRAFCEKCQEDYFLNYLLYTEDTYLFKNDSQKRKLSLHLNEMILGKSGLKFIKVCERVSVLNCLTPANAKECLKCDDGYFKNSQNKCVVFPEEGILNCFKYNGITTCVECLSGYYLQSSSTCVVVEPITNCLQYDGTANSSKCSECRSGFYSSGSSCTERVNSKGILNCKKLADVEDKCKECNPNFILASDGLRCFTKITSCETYGDQSSANDSALCTKCNSGFYLADTKTCLQGNVANCDIYKNRPEDCDTCLNSYYINSGKCEKHNTLSNCEKYSNTDQNTCLTCEGNFYNFKVIQICKIETPINNCVEYEPRSPLKCTKCELGYFKNGNQCDFIQESNCAEFNGTQCTNCDANYALDLTDTNPKCTQIFSHISANCEITSVSTIPTTGQNMSEVKCEKCTSFSIPIDHRRQYVCVRNDQLSLMGITNERKVSGCIKYNQANTCVQCDTGKYLELDNTCVTTCNSGVYKVNHVTKTGQDSSLTIVHDGYNRCMDTNTNNFSVYAFNLDVENTTSVDIPVKCKDNYLPIVYTSSKEHTNVDYTKQPEQFVEHPLKVFPAISVCEESTSNSGLLSNCEYYTYVMLKGLNEVRCLKCKQGYNSVISKGELNINSGISYYMSQCERDTLCKNEQFYGLDLIWNKFFSCHQCSSSTNIPFLAIKHESASRPNPQKFVQYSLKQLDHNANLDDSLKNIECIPDKLESFGYDKDVQTQVDKYQSLPLHCALGVINTTQTDGDSLGNRTAIAEAATSATKLSQYCAACKPGYKATRLNDVFYFIKVQCTKIDNCVGTKWFNNCSQCSTNHVYKFEDGQINYAACIQNIVQNCYSANDKENCIKCMKGFNLNKDNQCEAVQPPNCKSATNFNTRVEYTNKKNIAYGIYHDSLGIGCSECVSGFTAVELTDTNSNPYVCTTSNYIQQKSTSLPDTTNLVRFCENYAYENDNLICKKCLDNYVLNPNQDNCYNGPTGCEQADSEVRCLKCLLEYTLVNNVCIQGNISFCKEYNLDQNVQTPKCLKCEPDYYVTNTFECDVGEVTNCEWYFDLQKNKCRKCKDGYALFKSGDFDYCYKISETLNCKEATIRNNNTFGAEIECTLCNEPHQLLTNLQQDIEQKSKCQEFTVISNCKTYDKKETINESSLSCNECNPGFYLSSPRNCLNRSYTSVQCTKYEMDKDRCKECDSVSYKNDIGQCLPKPSGIQNCKEYEDLSKCKVCDVNNYIENNQCKAVPNENLIAGCDYYLNNNTCQTCQKGYVITGNICEVATATGCLTYASVSQCDSCDIGYGLQDQNGIVNCVLVNKPHCLEFTQNGDFPCTKCDANFYLDSTDNCVQASPQIANCEYYESNDSCQACAQGSALSTDGKKCEPLSSFTSEFDENCRHYKNSVHCSVCRPGSFFEGTTCTLCDDSNGCFKCNPDKTEECWLCQSGYYMNSDLKCVSISTTPTNPPSPISNEKIFKMIFVLLLLC